MANTDLSNAERWEVEAARDLELERIEKQAPKDERKWFTRNKWWLIGLVPAVAAVAVTSSFRYVQVYLPNTYSASASAAAGESVRFDREYRNEDATFRRSGEVKLIGLQKVDQSEVKLFKPTAPVDIWAVGFDWKAPSDVPLSWCDAWLVAEDGEEYGYDATLLGPTQQAEKFRDHL